MSFYDTYRHDAWRDSYDSWKLRSPDWDEPEPDPWEEDPLIELWCAHDEPMSEHEAWGLFEFWESEG